MEIKARKINDSEKLHCIIPKYAAILLYDIKTQIFLYCKLRKSDHEIPIYHSSFLLKNEIYMFGGFYKSTKIFNENTFSINLNNFELNSLESKTSNPKIASAICFLDKYIYSIGGKNRNLIRTNDCQRFNIIEKKWYKIAEMNNIRCSPSVCTFNSQEIYVFFGINQLEKPINDIIEKYDCLSDQWIQIPLLFHPFPLIYQASALQINEKDVFLFGGYLKNGQIFEENRNFYVFNTEIKDFSCSEQNFVALLGSSQTCNCILTEKKEIITLRFINYQLKEEIKEFPENLAVLKITEKNIQVEDIINCSHFSLK